MADVDGKSVPPVPYKAALVDARGLLTPAWAAWFRQVFTRVGGHDALSNTELAQLPSLSLSDVQADITTLQSDLGSLQNELASDFASLGQGREL
jgi:hypothetical protein